ncbi:MAG: DUF1934 domain-containing protein [Eubacteriales bacterium]|nr:DUF1934 domain-containing protein [Eubacteriales bacterium]
MSKDVIISVRTVHDDEENAMDFITDGVYSFEDGLCSMSYMESNVTGMDGTRTTVTFMPDEVIIDREGSITSRMVFREGTTNRMSYSTPFGNTVMGLDTKKIYRSFGPDGGSAEIDYVLGVQHRVFTRAKLFISVERQGERTDA